MNIKDCMFFTVNSLLKDIHDHMEQGFRQLGISSSYAYLIVAIEQHENIGTVELATELNLKPSTITRLVDKMVQQGYVTRKSSGKRTQIRCTDKGHLFSKEIIETLNHMRKGMEEYVGIGTIEALNTSINQFRTQLKKIKQNEYKRK